MRSAQILLGALIAMLVFAAVCSLVYGWAVFLLAQHDGSVFRGLQDGDFLGAVRDWLGHAQSHQRNSAAVIGCAAGLAAAVAFAILALSRPPRGAAFQSSGNLSMGGFFKSNSLFLGRAGGISIEWPRWHYDPVTKTRELRPWRKLVGGRYVHSPYFGHVLVSGPTRSGKGAAYIIPNALEFAGSMLILDIRGETFDQTAGFRAGFSKVIKLAPAQEHSHGYNPLDFVRKQPGLYETDIVNITAGIIRSHSTREEYWMKDARELLAGAMGYVLETDSEPEKNLGAVMDILIGREDCQERLNGILARHKQNLSNFTVSKLVPFAAMAQKQFQGLYGELRTALAPYNNVLTRKMLARSSFNLFDVRKEPHSIYVDFRLSQLVAMSGFANVLISQMLNYLTDRLRASGEHQVMFLLDEFTTLGKIAPLVPMLKVAAGNGISVWSFVQSMTDVKELYGETGLDSILDNSEALVFLGGESRSVLEYLERQIGKKLVKRSVKRRSTGNNALVGQGSIEDREIEVPLMTSDELRQISRRHAIVLPRASAPILLNRNYFFADKRFAKLAGMPVKAGLVPSLVDGLPEQFTPNVALAIRVKAMPESRVRGQLPFLALLPRPPLAFDEASFAKPGNVFLMNASIAARRAGSAGGVISPFVNGTAVTSKTSAKPLSSVPTIMRQVVEPASPMAVEATFPIQTTAAPVPVTQNSNQPEHGHTIALACLWMVKLRDVLPLQVAGTIEEATGCQRFGDLVQNPWAKIAAISGLTVAAKRELRRIVKTLGLEWSTLLAPWPPIGPPAFLDS
ncbi:MAG: type IV secretory system conjugative DNA transfer family protein, partial [Beijerinckiaceae bacterium]